MTMHQDPEAEPRFAPHRWLPVAGVIVAGSAILAHLAGGAALIHLGLGAALAYVGADVANLGGWALAVGLAALVGIKLLVVFAARRWRPHR